MAQNQPEMTVAPDQHTRPWRRALALASVVAVATVGVALVDVDAGAGKGPASPTCPNPEIVVQAPKLPDLTDPVTRRRFADSFAPGYFG